MFKIKTKKTATSTTLTSQKRIQAPQTKKTANLNCGEDVLKNSINHRPPMNRTTEGRPITANGSKQIRNGGLSNRRGALGLKHSNSNNFNVKSQKRMNTQYNSQHQSYNLGQNLLTTIQLIFNTILRDNKKFSNLTQKEHEQLQRIKQKIKTRSQLIWLKVTMSTSNIKQSQCSQLNQQQNEEANNMSQNVYQSTLKRQILKEIQKERKLTDLSSQCNSRMGKIESMINNRLQKLQSYCQKRELVKA